MIDDRSRQVCSPPLSRLVRCRPEVPRARGPERPKVRESERPKVREPEPQDRRAEGAQAAQLVEVAEAAGVAEAGRIRRRLGPRS